PVRIEVESTAETAPIILQRAIQVDPKRRTQLLKKLVEESDWDQVLVFVATKYATEHVSDKLWKQGIKAAALHGELSQGGRTKVLAALKNSEIQVLVATDVAARGLDIPELPVVLNYDLPRSASDYTHRIGRTGRAGESGVAISFVSGHSANGEAHFRLIEKRQAQRVPREQIAGFEPTDLESAPSATGGVKGLRKSKKDKLREAAAAAAAASALA
ncbi:C-terminal helicase domain-containing protein, partial [Roseateles sp.]|uniref:C-terminal helicase domain-containing protein n=1 Tax=Roseateles sp. TaxID=1971397 RepID=UPI00286AF835